MNQTNLPFTWLCWTARQAGGPLDHLQPHRKKKQLPSGCVWKWRMFLPQLRCLEKKTWTIKIWIKTCVYMAIMDINGILSIYMAWSIYIYIYIPDVFHDLMPLGPHWSGPTLRHLGGSDQFSSFPSCSEPSLRSSWVGQLRGFRRFSG